jgi:ammonium transporter, Amt family
MQFASFFWKCLIGMIKKQFLPPLLLLLFSSFAFAAEPSNVVEVMNTLWVLIAACLVFLMQAGFALLESGLSRAKNAVNVMMKNYMDLCVGSILFWLVGYGLMFGNNVSGFFGTDLFALSSMTDWHYTTLFFQTMFAATAATIVSGAVAERTNYAAYLLGAIGLTAFIYPVFGSWVWNEGGWLNQMGFIDFAGSTVVHSVGGWAALAAIMVLGPRLGRFGPDKQPRNMPGHNLNYVAIGGLLLWFGWFGFNGGSTLAAGTNIGHILLNTHLAGAAGALGALAVHFILRQPALMTSGVNGSIAGLVAITAGCATMEVHFAVLTGLIGGVISVLGNKLIEKMGLDDVVGAVSVHGFAGVWGTLAAGLFLTGNLFDPHQVTVQLIGIAAAFVWVMMTAFVMYWLIANTVGMRVSTMHEQRGLDITEHGEIGYPEFSHQAAYTADKLNNLEKL